MEYISWLLLAMYGCFLLSVGFFSKKGSSAFYVNSRSSSAAAVAFSIVVTCIGASATLGMVGLSFAVGTPGFWWLGAGVIGLTLQALLLSKKVRKSSAYTLPGIVENALGTKARSLISFVVAIAWLGILAAQFTAILRVLESMTGLSENPCRVIAFLLIVMHCLGGQAAIIKADKIQAAILLGALVLLLGWLSYSNAGWTSYTTIEVVNANFPLDKWFYFLIIIGANYLVCPMIFSRLLCAKDEKTAQKAAFLGAFGIACCAALIVAVGLASRGLIPSNTPQDSVLTTVISTQFPRWMSILVSFALVSAIVSSADTCLVTVANILSCDIVKTKDVRVGRGAVLFVGFLGIGVSLMGKGILSYLLMSYDVFASGVVVPVFIGFLANRKYAILPNFAFAAMIAGGILGVAAAINGQPLYSYVGMVVSGTITLIGMRRSTTAA